MEKMSDPKVFFSFMFMMILYCWFPMICMGVSIALIPLFKYQGWGVFSIFPALIPLIPGIFYVLVIDIILRGR